MGTTAITPNGAFPTLIPPLSNISPFTYRDGMTYLELLYALRDYTTGTVRDEFNTKMSQIIADFNAGMSENAGVITELGAEWNTRYDNFIANFTNELKALNDDSVAGMVNDTAGPTRAALDTLISEEIDTATAALQAYADNADKGKVSKGELVLNVKDYGAKGDGTTDDTAAIQAAINAATPGSTLYFPPAPSSYRITAGLTLTTPNVRFSVGSRDYGTSIKCTTPGVTMLTVKETQFINELTWIGNGGTGGAAATVNGIDLYGDTSSNNDSLIGGTFIYLNVPLRIRGRNTDVDHALFSNSLAGVVVDGVDTTYHTATVGNADKRGTTIRNSRFHDVQDKAIELTPTACVLSAIITGNFFDSGSPTRAIYAVGTSALPHRKLTIRNNKITESSADAITLTWVQNSTIRSTDIAGWGVGTGGSALLLDNCTDLDVNALTVLQVGRSAVVGTNSTRVRLDNIKVRAIGYDTATVADAVNFNATNTGCEFTRLSVEGADGWGFNGDPASSTLADCRFSGCTLGTVNSATVHARGASGRNVYIEGTGGRKDDYASKAFDPASTAGFAVAGVTPASAYASYVVDVEVIGRSNAGALYYKGSRYVRPESGAQVVTTIGTDTVIGGVTVNYTPGSGAPYAISIASALADAGAHATYHVRARAGAGASSTDARGVTVAMA